MNPSHYKQRYRLCKMTLVPAISNIPEVIIELRHFCHISVMGSLVQILCWDTCKNCKINKIVNSNLKYPHKFWVVITNIKEISSVFSFSIYVFMTLLMCSPEVDNLSLVICSLKSITIISQILFYDKLLWPFLQKKKKVFCFHSFKWGINNININ